MHRVRQMNLIKFELMFYANFLFETPNFNSIRRSMKITFIILLKNRSKYFYFLFQREETSNFEFVYHIESDAIRDDFDDETNLL